MPLNIPSEIQAEIVNSLAAKTRHKINLLIDNWFQAMKNQKTEILLSFLKHQNANQVENEIISYSNIQ